MLAQITQSFDEVQQISPREGVTVGLIGQIENLRGVYEGTYRQSQFMTLVKNFLADPPVGIIRARLEFVLSSGTSGESSGQTFADIGERARFVKAMLGLIQELSFNRDCRMGFNENSKCLKTNPPYAFLPANRVLSSLFFQLASQCNTCSA